jgi:AraC-like DNA-binding protein
VVSEQSYVERPPVRALRDLVRVVWVQRIGAEPYAQRNLPTGGVELHCTTGALPRLIGPLTASSVEVLAPGATVVGVRFRPGAAASVFGLPASELVDLTLSLDGVWGAAAVVLGERLLGARSPEVALCILQEELVLRRADGAPPDPLVSEAVRRLMPWRGGGVGSLSSLLAISESQLRRRCLAAAGIGPKALQRTLRFQGFLALVQSTTVRATPPDGGGLAELATEVGYADQAHLSRECVRLTGLPPRAFLTEKRGRCGCGHDHAASFIPFLRGHPLPTLARA